MLPLGSMAEIQGLCLDTAGESTANYAQAVLNTCGTSATQVWTPGSYNTLVNKASGFCLTTASNKNKALLYITGCYNTVAETWRLPTM